MNSLDDITNKVHDICMMVREGGKERTEKEYKELLTVETVFELKISLRNFSCGMHTKSVISLFKALLSKQQKDEYRRHVQRL